VRSLAGDALDRGDRVGDVVERSCHRRVHLGRIRALDEARLVAVADHQGAKLFLGDPREDGRVGDLVAVQVQDRQHGAVARGVDEFVRMPARRQRARLRLAVSDDAAHDQVSVVESRSVGVRERISELPALVNRSRCLRSDVARDPARVGELPEQPAQPLLAVADVRVHLGVGALEVGVGDESRPAVPRPGHVEHAEVALPNQAVQVRVDEVEPRRGAPVAEQARLHVLQRQRLAKQRVIA
jgi:hypothetical protein